MRSVRWAAAVLATLLTLALLPGCSVLRDQRTALVEKAIKTDLAGDFDGLKALYTPEHREFLNPRATMGAVYRGDAGGVTPKIRHLQANTVFNANGRAVVLASFDFYDAHQNHFVVAATYNLTEYSNRWYILGYKSEKNPVP